MGSEVGGMAPSEQPVLVPPEECEELGEAPEEETPSKKAPIGSLTLEKQLTSKRSRNDMVGASS